MYEFRKHNESYPETVTLTKLCLQRNQLQEIVTEFHVLRYIFFYQNLLVQYELLLFCHVIKWSNECPDFQQHFENSTGVFFQLFVPLTKHEKTVPIYCSGTEIKSFGKNLIKFVITDIALLQCHMGKSSLILHYLPEFTFSDTQRYKIQAKKRAIITLFLFLVKRCSQRYKKNTIKPIKSKYNVGDKVFLFFSHCNWP